MSIPFGVAVYPDRGRSTLDPLPPTLRTRTYHESQYGLVEDGMARLITPAYQKREHGDDDRPRSPRGAPGRETAGVRRRPTTVRRELADDIMLAVIAARQRLPRSHLARYIGITPRELHLAELGSVQPAVVQRIVNYFGLDLDEGESRTHTARITVDEPCTH